jgi:hypothetical protein
MGEEPRPQRPVRTPDIERLGLCPTELGPEARLELAHVTAGLVIREGRRAEEGSLVYLAEVVGLDTLADLWRHAPLDSLPGVLWALYLLRAWCRENGAEVARLYEAGRDLAPVEEVVAGVADSEGPDAVLAMAEAVLEGMYRGDVGVALERGAAFLRVVAAGRDSLAAPSPERGRELAYSAKNRSCAAALDRAAQAWRSGALR